METCFTYCENDGIGWFSSDERKWINRIRRLKEAYPNDVEIRTEPETNDGCITCKVPQSWLKIQPPPKHKTLTDEEKAEIRERLAQGQANKRNQKSLL